MNENFHIKDGNYTRVHNKILEALMKTHISGYEIKIILAIWRKIYGWGKKEDFITFKQFQKMTGLPKSEISRTLTRLKKRNLVVENYNSKPVKYRFNKHFQEWKELEKTTTDVENYNKRCRKLQQPLEKTTTKKVISVNDIKDLQPPKETITKETLQKKEPLVANQNHLRLVVLLKTLILQNDPKAKIPDDITKWIDPIDKLERIDGRTLIEIEGVIRFSQANDFWKSNILSTRNLRKHFPQLVLQAKKGGFIVTPRPEPKPETPEEKAKREKREKEEEEVRYQEGLKNWRGMSLEKLRKEYANLIHWGKIAKIPPVQVGKDLEDIIKEKEKNG